LKAVVTIVDRILRVFETQGKAAYLGEPVSQEEHALQAAYLAEQQGAPKHLIAAALLHDVGHLLHGLPQQVVDDIADRGIDGRHEVLGEAFLRNYFGTAVADPVRLHVDAKRYLCYSDPEYLGQLSPASVQSLQLQGGPFSSEQAAQFENHPQWADALRLRRWDDQAKIPGLDVPGVEHYRIVLEESLL
jgi:phosphonate degradation associated HDIG domain protein